MGLFMAALEGTGANRTFLIKAESGMGKSSLLMEFYARAASARRAILDLKPNNHSVYAVLAALARDLDHTKFERLFSRESRDIHVTMTHNKLRRADVDIDLSGLPTRVAEQYDAQLISLTRDFFTDLEESRVEGQRTVLIFDTFQRALPEVQDWIAETFLGFARKFDWLVIVIAGRTIPEPGLGWDNWCVEQTLRPLGPDYINEWVSRVDLSLSPDQLAILYDTTDGIPLELKTQLGRLILKRGISRVE
jgi:hypothetical protein